MIDVDQYTTELTTRLVSKPVGNFTIKKRLITKGTVLRMYSPAGYFYSDTFNKDFPSVRLVEGENQTWMSDTPSEQEGLAVPTNLARGNILIIGLGVGLFPILLEQRNKAVKAITIVESRQEVVDLVYDCIMGNRTSVEVADGETYLTTTDKKFDFIFVDVWGSFTSTIKGIDHWTNLAQRCLNKDGEVRCWLQELYNRIKSQLPKDSMLVPGPAAVYPPCIICGKKLRFDYAGLCMDCADDFGVSEAFCQ